MIESHNIFDIEDENDDFDRDNPENRWKLVQNINTDLTEITDDEEQNHDITRAQIDTGASVSVTNEKELLHRYKPFNEQRKCPIRLNGAINMDEAIIPEGSGYLRIPTNFIGGYIDVKTYYSPTLSATLVSENDILKGAVNKWELGEYSGQTLHKIFEDTVNDRGRMLLVNHHKRNKSRNIVLHGVILQGQYYTQPLIPPDKFISQVLAKDEPSRKNLQAKLDRAVDVYVERKLKELGTEIMASGIGAEYKQTMETCIRKNVPVNAIRTRTEKMLWHQRLGHPNDEYLYNAHKYIDGVPKFERETPVLDLCPTCIQSKQTKEPAGPNSTKSATTPFQGLSIDFAFSGTKSKNEERRLDYEGLNGETCYVLITDHATGMKIGDTRLSKAPPLIWLRNFLATYSPKCNDKYVFMDQGGEFFKALM